MQHRFTPGARVVKYWDALGRFKVRSAPQADPARESMYFVGERFLKRADL